MDKSIIPHVFASLLSLERHLHFVADSIEAEEGEKQAASRALLAQQRKVIEHMRRVANSLQLHVASNDAPAAVRALRVFYGLNHMVRPELFAARVAASQSKAPIASPAPAPLQTSTVH